MALTLFVKDEPLTDDEYREMLDFFDEYGIEYLLSILFEEMDKNGLNIEENVTDNQKMQTLYECKYLDDAYGSEYPDIEAVIEDIVYTLTCDEKDIEEFHEKARREQMKIMRSQKGNNNQSNNYNNKQRRKRRNRNHKKNNNANQNQQVEAAVV